MYKVKYAQIKVFSAVPTLASSLITLSIEVLWPIQKRKGPSSLYFLTLLCCVLNKKMEQTRKKIITCPDQIGTFLRDDRQCGQRWTRIIVYDDCLKEESEEGITGCFISNMQLANPLIVSMYLIYSITPVSFCLKCRAYSAKPYFI